MVGQQQANQHSPSLPVIDGYRDLTLVGSGGYSQVYTAWQERFARTVAVKVITVELSDTALRRFGREQTTTGQLDGHPHVIRVYDSGFTADRQPYLTMEYHEQGALSDRVRHEGPLPVDEVLAIGVKLACALDAAHRRGTIHRDVKPQNVLVSPFVGPVLADFGIAAVDDARIRTITSEAFSALHVAPEVLEGHQATPISDLYSLASTMYELLAGRAPFAADEDPGLLALMRRIRTEELPPIPRDDIPPQLSSALSRMLAREVDERPGSGLAMAEALRAVQTEIGLDPTPLVPDPAGPGVDRGGEQPPAAASDPGEMAPPSWAQSAEPAEPAEPTEPPAPTPPPTAPAEPPEPTPPPNEPVEPLDLETTGPRGAPSASPRKQPERHAQEGPQPPPIEADDPLTHTTSRELRRDEVVRPLIGDEEKKSRLPLIIVSSTAAVLLLGIAVWFFLLRETDSDDEAAPTATTEPDPADILPPCPATVTGSLDVFPGDVVESEPPTGLELEQSPDGASAQLSWDDPNGGTSYYVVYVRCESSEQDNLPPVALTSPGEPPEAVVEDLSLDHNYCFTVGVWQPRPVDDEGNTVELSDQGDTCLDDPADASG